MFYGHFRQFRYSSYSFKQQVKPAHSGLCSEKFDFQDFDDREKEAAKDANVVHFWRLNFNRCHCHFMIFLHLPSDRPPTRERRRTETVPKWPFEWCAFRQCLWLNRLWNAFEFTGSVDSRSYLVCFCEKVHVKDENFNCLKRMQSNSTLC